MGLLVFQVIEVSVLSSAGYCSFYCKHNFGWWGGGCVQLGNQEEGGAIVSVGEIWY